MHGLGWQLDQLIALRVKHCDGPHTELVKSLKLVKTIINFVVYECGLDMTFGLQLRLDLQPGGGIRVRSGGLLDMAGHYVLQC